MTCRTCKHVSVVGFSDPYGACRRFPPTVLSQTESTFPLVHLDNFTCGEFSRAKTTAHPTPSKSGIEEKKRS